jgi:RNA polymerase sigma factor (sigma-70 family)
VNEQTDSQLLHDYAERRSEPAFAELVRRHVGPVYSAAQRMVCDAHLAEDVTQGVFLALAKEAGGLKDRPVLSGWLHRAAQNIAAQTVRTDVRRRLLEQQAAAMTLLLSSESEASWDCIAPDLDAALGELSDSDRDALMLRYFENKSASQMASILGISDEAAQKRVSRAVEHLRNFFAKHGVTVGASGLVALISANAVQAAPVSLAATITAAALLSGTIATPTTMNLINIKAIASVIAVALATGTGIYFVQQREANRLRNENRSLVEAQENLATERNAALSAAAATSNEVNQLRKDRTDLLRLRSEIARLRQQTSGLSALVPVAQWQARIESQNLQSPEAGLSACTFNLQRIYAAMQMCALENHLSDTNLITPDQIESYLKENQLPKCPSGGTYTLGRCIDFPTCSIPGHLLPLAERTPADEASLKANAIIDAAYRLDHDGKSGGDVFAEVVEAYKRDHSGQTPKGEGDLKPYIKPEGERFRLAKDAYKRDHDGQAITATNFTELASYLLPYLQRSTNNGH